MFKNSNFKTQKNCITENKHYHKPVTFKFLFTLTVSFKKGWHPDIKYVN